MLALSTRPTIFDDRSYSTCGTTYPVDVSWTCACAGETSAISVSETSVLKSCASRRGAAARHPTNPRTARSTSAMSQRSTLPPDRAGA